MKKHAINTQHGVAEVLEHGAHLCSWQCDGREQLFVSEEAIYQEGTALRGGVPVCFPQFAAFGPGAKHGFARNALWQFKSQSDDSLTFVMEANDETRALWPHDFKLAFNITLAERALTMKLTVTNTGNSTFQFGAALHTYFRCEDVRNIQVQGLKGCRYWDNGTPFDQRDNDASESLGFSGPFDRVYFDAPDSVTLVEGDSSKEIHKAGFADIVVWNPWLEGAQGLKDMANNEYLNMICVEAAAVDRRLRLEAEQSWLGEQHIKIR